MRLFAPLNVPLHRRLETLAVLYHIFCVLFLPTVAVVVSFELIFTSYRIFVLLYAIWLYYDFQKPFQGARPCAWYRNCVLWKWFCDYFPIKLVKTAELPPEHNYIVGSHPHGILSLGVFPSFATNGTGFAQMFPGITPTLCTLNVIFCIPLVRELSMASGGISVSKESISYQLSKEKKGQAVAIVIGGAEEALDSNPDNYDLTLAHRKGFVKIALQHGAHLVPLYNFGENKTFAQLDSKRGTILRKLQEVLKHFAGFSVPLFHGRGVFNYFFGFLPYRVPINSVVGAPIPVEKVENPTWEQINELHRKYCDALVKLFDDHKVNYGIGAETKINIY